MGSGALKVEFDSLMAEAATPPTMTTGDGDNEGAERPRIGSAAADDGAGDRGAMAEAAAAAGVDGGGPGTGVAAAVSGEEVDLDDSVLVDPASSGRPWSELGAAEGLLTFRGNPTRTYHGRGPVPDDAEVLWSFPIGCANSSVGNEIKQWCGSGWTGQPAVFRSPVNGQWTLAFGAYNRSVNFLDPVTGTEVMSPYPTADIIKGSVTIDPDGFPLLYTGSRDNYFHVVALDRGEPQQLWSLSADAVQPTMWNNDWDGSALVIDDRLYVGGENGRFFVIDLHRNHGPDGEVTVAPEIAFTTESWDDELLAAIGDQEVSVENSVAISGDTVYFANSGGLVQGWDMSGLDEGRTPTRTFRFWTGDDTDATIVIDDEGMLYVASEYERGTARSEEVGQIMKLDPSSPDDPLVWGQASRAGLDSGVWATPALWRDLLIVATNEGEVRGLDRTTGEQRWSLPLQGPLWSSPVVVDDVLIQGDCGGVLHAFDLTAGDVPLDRPAKRWAVELGGCIESTPAVWDGRLFVGTRAGNFYAVG